MAADQTISPFTVEQTVRQFAIGTQPTLQLPPFTVEATVRGVGLTPVPQPALRTLVAIKPYLPEQGVTGSGVARPTSGIVYPISV